MPGTYINPAETGFYYLGSRYYDPEIGRFINADEFLAAGNDITGMNRFAYCGNNPVNRIDVGGKLWFPVVFMILLAGLCVSTYNVATYYFDKAIDEAATNDAEKELAKKNYYDAYQVKRSKDIADEYTEKIYNVNVEDEDNNEPNAYRHAMWSAVMTDKIGAEKAKAFGEAHEKVANYAAWKDNCEMDLFNNALGRSIAIEYAGQGYDVFSEKIIEAINNGEAMIIDVE